jgi:hypothetical protein
MPIPHRAGSARSITKKLRLRRGPITPKALSGAIAEVKKTSMRAIEDATGRTWGARALASWQAALEAKADGREAEFLEHYAHAITFRDEAIEHAASGHKGTLTAIERQLREIPY